MRRCLPTLLAMIALTTGCSNSYRVGDHVMVDWENNTEYAAKVVAVESPGKYKVHFDDYDSVWDEAVAATRIHGKVQGTPVAPPPPAKVRARTSGGKQSQSKWKIGDKVKSEWKGSFYPAEIKAVLGGERYRIRYDGYDQNWDENVDVARIQRRLSFLSDRHRGGIGRDDNLWRRTDSESKKMLLVKGQQDIDAGGLGGDDVDGVENGTTHCRNLPTSLHRLRHDKLVLGHDHEKRTQSLDRPFGLCRRYRWRERHSREHGEELGKRMSGYNPRHRPGCDGPQPRIRAVVVHVSRNQRGNED